MQRAAFWLAVMGASLIAPIGMNLIADSKAGEVFPALRTVNRYTTRTQN